MRVRTALVESIGKPSLPHVGIWPLRPQPQPAEVVRAALKKIEAIVLMNPYNEITSERILDTIREVFGEQ